MPGVFLQRRLGIEGVDMRRAAVEEKMDDAFGLRREMRLFGREWIGGSGDFDPANGLRETKRAHAHATAEQEIASGGAGAPLSSMHCRNSSSFCRSSLERSSRITGAPAAPPGGAGIWNDCVPAPLPLLRLPPLSASETAATPTAVIPAASSERPSGPRRIVMPLFFFIATPLIRVPVAPGSPTMKPAAAERRLRRS